MITSTGLDSIDLGQDCSEYDVSFAARSAEGNDLSELPMYMSKDFDMGPPVCLGELKKRIGHIQRIAGRLPLFFELG